MEFSASDFSLNLHHLFKKLTILICLCLYIIYSIVLILSFKLFFYLIKILP